MRDPLPLLSVIFAFATTTALTLLALRYRTRKTSPAEKPAADAGTTTAQEPPAPQALPDPLIDPAVLVSKSTRTLTVFSAGQPVKSYRVALSDLPGPKQREGDRKTPEGSYYVCTRNERSRHTRFLGLSYPNMADADTALAERRISAGDHRAILQAQRRMQRPPWKTALGGEIGIHGGGADRDWTFGCIALEDADALELFGALPMGTPVEIMP